MRVLVVGYDSVYVLYLRQDLPFALRQRVQELGPQRAFSDGEHVRAILAENAPCEDIWSGVTYIFPSALAATPSPNVVQLKICSVTVPCLKHISQSEVLARASHYGIIVDGRLVASCTSSRENTQQLRPG